MVVDSAGEDKVKQQWPALKSSPALIDCPPLEAALVPPWSMVAIQNHRKHNNDDTPIIFPPANHENLHICPDLPPHIHINDLDYSSSDSGLVSDSDSNSSTTFSPTDSDSPPFASPKATPVAVVSRRFDSWQEILCSKLKFAAQFLLGYVVSSGRVFLTSRSVVTTAVLVLSLLYFRQRRRLRAGEETRARLTGVINEKEKKINQLLDQISRMNQVLLGFHRAPATT